MESLKHRESLRLRGWWRIVCCRDKNQARLAAVGGGALQEEEVLWLGRRWRWWRWRWRDRWRGRQRNELQAAGCLNHEVVLGGVRGNI